MASRWRAAWSVCWAPIRGSCNPSPVPEPPASGSVTIRNARRLRSPRCSKARLRNRSDDSPAGVSSISPVDRNLGLAVKRYHVTTFGCQMNEHDSERMKGMLESLGYSEAADRSSADLILFNTCSIREKADNRLVGHLGESKRLKQEDPAKV